MPTSTWPRCEAKGARERKPIERAPYPHGRQIVEFGWATRYPAPGQMSRLGCFNTTTRFANDLRPPRFFPNTHALIDTPKHTIIGRNIKLL